MGLEILTRRFLDRNHKTSRTESSQDSEIQEDVRRSEENSFNKQYHECIHAKED